MRTAFNGPGRLRLPPQGGLLLVRHAERHTILSFEHSYTAGLTAGGRASALAFGAELGRAGWRIESAAASPAPRCLDTARLVLEGALDGAHPHPPVQPLPVLHFDQNLTGIPGLQGILFTDEGLVQLAARPHSPQYTLLRETLLASLPFPSGPGALSLAVTHDVLVTFLQASLLGLPGATPQDFPGYLEGLALVRQADGQVRIW